MGAKVRRSERNPKFMETKSLFCFVLFTLITTFAAEFNNLEVNEKVFVLYFLPLGSDGCPGRNDHQAGGEGHAIPEGDGIRCCLL
jgi:hypothetical protein